MAKKNAVVELKISSKEVTKLGGTLWYKLGNDVMHQNTGFGKPMNPDGSIVLSRKSKLCWAFASKGRVTTTYQVTLNDLERLLAKAKKQKAYFTALDKKRKKQEKSPIGSGFFVHLSPDLSFFVVEQK